MEWLRQAIDSVRAQTLEAWEIVIVSDEPLELTADLEDMDPRIRILPGAQTGPAANRNIGVRAARAEYVAFLDADDLFVPEKLQRQLAMMQQQRASFSHTSYDQIATDGTHIATMASGSFGGDVYPRIYLCCPLATPTVMARRDLLLANPFDERLRVGEDTLTWIALGRQARLLGIDEPLSRVRIHGRNAALDPEAQIAAWRSIGNLALPADPTLAPEVRVAIHSEVHWTIGLLEWRRGRWIAAGRSALRAFALRPRSLVEKSLWRRGLGLITRNLRAMATRGANPVHPIAPRRGRRRIGERPVEWISRDDAVVSNTIRSYLEPARSVLDVGPGIRPQTLLSPEIHICVEPYEPYIERLRYELPSESRFLFFTAPWDRVLPHIADQSIDTVVALDVIEHLGRREGWRLLSEALRIARQQVVIFTPLGFYRQRYSWGQADRWGMRGARWQTHRSGWVPEDFPLPWRIVACKDFHNVDEHDELLDVPFGAFWAIHTRRAGPAASPPSVPPPS